MARDKVELLVQLVGKDGITKILDAAATEALKLDQRMKKGQKSSKGLSNSIKKIGSSWTDVTVGLNQGLELFSKISDAAGQVLDTVKETARQRQVEARFVNQLNVSMEALNKASGFQLTDIELKKFALQAKQAGVSMGQFEKLLDVALRASIATGKDFGEVFEGLFVDTVLGATDSYLEQLGIVKDLGKETENYASKNFILKENIDKTTQSQAALNVVLTEVNDRFKGVKADKFISELARAAKAAEKIQEDLKKAGTFLVVDVLDALNVTKIGKGGALDQLVKLQKQIEKLENAPAEKRVITGKGSTRVRMLEANLTRIKELRKQIGELAKANEEVKNVLFRDLSDQAKLGVKEFDQIKNAAEMASEAVLALSGNARLVEFKDSRTQAEKYDTVLIELAKSYGLADVAQQEFTTSAINVQTGVRRFITQPMGEASRAMVGVVKDFKSLSSSILTDPLFQKGLAGDANALAEFFFGKPKKKKQKKPRRGGGKRRMTAAEFDVMMDAKDLAIQHKQVMEAFKKAEDLAKKQKLEDDENFFANQMRVMMESLEQPASAFEQELARLMGITMEDFQWLSPLEIQMETLNLSFDAASQGMLTTASALQLMGEAAGASSDRMARLAHTGQALEALTPRLQLATKTIFDMAKATDMSAGQMAAGVGTVTAAALEGAAGFITGEKEKAAVSSAVEVARAGAAFAMFATTLSPNYAVAGSMHLVNAGLFAAIAGGAGAPGASSVSAGGAGGGAAAASGARRIPTFGQQMQNQNMQAAQVVVNMSGAIVAGANRRKTANDLGDLVQESMAGRR